jgi:hypothetical protein
MVEETVVLAEKSHIRDLFGFQRLREAKYSATEIDGMWTDAMNADFISWFKSSPETKEYQYLDFEADIERMKKGDPSFFFKRERCGLAYNP